ncbi:MAG: epoxyqueuosine reductase [Clostridia bacterium]|nr:epoxyqueuosine reductase [Clostridia bacterium]
MSITASTVKEVAFDLGADLCGIAQIERFEDAPAGFHPKDVLPDCRSVIVFGVRFLKSSLYAKSTIPYTTVRNELSSRLNSIAVKLSEYLEDQGTAAVPMNTTGPDEWDEKTQKLRGIISLKHAAVQAGLGKIGKNTLLVNDKFGNMIWLNGVFVAEALEADPVAEYSGCIENCRLCLNSCPVKALDGISMDQQKCWNHAFGEHNGGEWRIKCFTCRKICPNGLGIK